VVDTGRHLVALDTGTAGMNPSSRLLPGNMRAAGIDPTKVTHVVISHFHGDHINGLLTGADATYPNAEVVVPAGEWSFWNDESNATRSPERQRGNFANTKRRFAPYQGKVRQVQDGAEAVPGIRSVVAAGHTPGHSCYHIADGTAQAMFLGDLTNRPELFVHRPNWHVLFDFDAEMAEAGRRRILDRVATERMTVMGYHYPFPANGHIARDGQGYRFHLADWQSSV
jgi:glyoxylase-like metal-dependent hydrolase (beta-lactamase superfamily II)